jgi:4-hydroxy-3-methylbut-2-enyl diphosphate reductase
MKIIVAKRAGFCFGVKRAIDIAFNQSKEIKQGVFTFGPLIHNPQVVKKLIEEGVTPIEDVYSPDIKTLIIRTHGVPPDTHKKMSQMGYNIIDATCPFVQKAQRYAQSLKEEGYQVVIIGDREHPEVQGLIGFSGDDAIVVNTHEQMPRLKSKVGIIVQTTQPHENLEEVVRRLVSFTRELRVFNTICDSTVLRLKETKELAQEVDIIIVVGGKNSANTSQLTNLSKSICAKVYHIETPGELRVKWFNGAEKVGITGGASTPQWLIDEVVEKIKEISSRR